MSFFWVAPGILVCWPDSFLLRVLISPFIWLVVFWGGGYVWVLVCKLVGVFRHLGCEFHVGDSEFIHCLYFLICRLGKVGECLLCTDKFVVSVAALARCILEISEIGLGLDEVGLEGRPVFFTCVLHTQQYSISFPISATIPYAIQTSWIYVTSLSTAIVKSTHLLILSMRLFSYSYML